MAALLALAAAVSVSAQTPPGANRAQLSGTVTAVKADANQLSIKGDKGEDVSVTTTDRTLWKDKAMTELNLAVLHSFTTAGITISDHHTESARFLRHIDREQRHGRACPADWTWIVPPAASSTTPVFHRYYQDFDQTPNFYRHPTPAQLKPALSHDCQPSS